MAKAPATSKEVQAPVEAASNSPMFATESCPVRLTGSFARVDEIEAGSARRFGYECELAEIEIDGDIHFALMPKIESQELLDIELKAGRVIKVDLVSVQQAAKDRKAAEDKALSDLLEAARKEGAKEVLALAQAAARGAVEEVLAEQEAQALKESKASVEAVNARSNSRTAAKVTEAKNEGASAAQAALKSE